MASSLNILSLRHQIMISLVLSIISVFSATLQCFKTCMLIQACFHLEDVKFSIHGAYLKNFIVFPTMGTYYCEFVNQITSINLNMWSKRHQKPNLNNLKQQQQILYLSKVYPQTKQGQQDKGSRGTNTLRIGYLAIAKRYKRGYKKLTSNSSLKTT